MAAAAAGRRGGGGRRRRAQRAQQLALPDLRHVVHDLRLKLGWAAAAAEASGEQPVLCAPCWAHRSTWSWLSHQKAWAEALGGAQNASVNARVREEPQQSRPLEHHLWVVQGLQRRRPAAALMPLLMLLGGGAGRLPERGVTPLLCRRLGAG